MLHRMLVIVLIVVSTQSLTTTIYAARRTKLSPVKVKQLREANQSYAECRSKALKAFQEKQLPKRRLQQMIDQCVEFFPAASFYTECKRQTLTEGPKNARKILNECRRFLIATTFDPKRPNPIMVYREDDSPTSKAKKSPRNAPADNSLFFAGIGLNHKLAISGFTPPNFDCSDLTEAFGATEKRQYLLFGNHPKLFFEDQTATSAKLLQMIQKYKSEAIRLGRQTRISDDGVVTPLGKVFGDPSKDDATVFFPAAACHFSGALGQLFSGLSAYYLVDDKDDTATPYFGIAYYRDISLAPSMATLSEEVRRALGPSYRVIRKNRDTIFLLSNNFKELDDENDPKNLCASPRKHQYAVVLQSQPNNLQRVNYLIVANVRNICEYGDRLARRLAD